MAKDKVKKEQKLIKVETNQELNMDKFLNGIDKDSLKSRLDSAKSKVESFDDKVMVDILFASKDGMYNAINVLNDFGINTDDKTNEDLQDTFKGHLKAMNDKIEEFVKSWYKLDDYVLILDDGNFTKGDVVLYMDKVR